MIASGSTLACLAGALAVGSVLQGGLTLEKIITGEDLSGNKLSDSERTSMVGGLVGGFLGGAAAGGIRASFGEIAPLVEGIPGGASGGGLVVVSPPDPPIPTSAPPPAWPASISPDALGHLPKAIIDRTSNPSAWNLLCERADPASHPPQSPSPLPERKNPRLRHRSAPRAPPACREIRTRCKGGLPGAPRVDGRGPAEPDEDECTVWGDEVTVGTAGANVEAGEGVGV
jgi:hypothetical protein